MSGTVGIVGLGIMGGAIARNLVERGWRVIGFDIDAATSAELARADITIAADVAQLARDETPGGESLSEPLRAAISAIPARMRPTTEDFEKASVQGSSAVR